MASIQCVVEQNEKKAHCIAAHATMVPYFPIPSNSANLYSSYAYMVSFDSSTGWAEFDYFNLLQGEAAAAWLVESEGYSESEAQAYVDNMADSEFLAKNTNPQLRTFSLRVVPIRMLSYPGGYDYPPEPDTVLTNYADLCTMYYYDHDLLIGSFFYYVTVNADASVEISQIWWP